MTKKKTTKKTARKAPTNKKPAAKKAARKRAPAKKPSPSKQKSFLAAYAGCGNITHAARMARCHRMSHYKWMGQAGYQEAYAEAHAEACDVLEGEARRRAVTGVAKPIYYQGVIVGTVKEYSDTLLIFLMKGAMPEKYRDNVKIEHDHSAELIEELLAGRARAARLEEERRQECRSSVTQNS